MCSKSILGWGFHEARTRTQVLTQGTRTPALRPVQKRTWATELTVGTQAAILQSDCPCAVRRRSRKWSG